MLLRGTEMQIGTGVEWVQTCEHSPGQFVQKYFDARIEWGKDGPGYIIKLFLNSLYGKSAQRIGRPPWANVIWAGLITSITRAKLLLAARDLGEDNVISFQTDGLFSLTDTLDSYPDGEAPLGEWEHELIDELFMIQSGVYVYRQGDKNVAKSRGFLAKYLTDTLDTFKAEWNDHGWLGEVALPTRMQFIGARLGVDRGVLGTIGTWQAQDRTISFASNSDKRALLPGGLTRTLLNVAGGCECADGGGNKDPLEAGEHDCSCPYGEDVLELVTAAVRETAAQGESPTGPEEILAI